MRLLRTESWRWLLAIVLISTCSAGYSLGQEAGETAKAPAADAPAAEAPAAAPPAAATATSEAPAAGAPAPAEAPPPTTEEVLGKLAVGVDTIWVMVCGMLVFFMNLGFGCVESGFCRAKNCVDRKSTR